ncbi:DUF1016 family protein [Candidatus Dojkabacteria bacterium]|nr:DUF1016 family protein [Candidatus Dojkabacteria bacterium]
MKKGELTVSYKRAFEEIKRRVYEGQLSALKVVNRELIKLYWDIGKIIVDRQEKDKWGRSTVEKLSDDLQKEFPGVRGFSVQNLWNMRKFYLTYQHSKKLQTVSGEIGWSHNVLIFEKCKEEKERAFYIDLTRKYGLSHRVLMNRIENDDYKLFKNNQTNFDKALEEKYRDQAKLAVKDEYTFGFLELNEEYSEKELEMELVKNIRSFLIEMGGDFSFMGQQYRLVVDGEEFFIDLLFFHRGLNRLVAIELKIGRFKPEYAGKMNFYLSVLEDKISKDHEEPPIGIVVCREKDRNIVRYALKDVSKPVGVSTYKIKKRSELPKAVSRLLPSERKIKEEVKAVVK